MVFTQEPDLYGDLPPEKSFQNGLKEEIISILEKKKADNQLITYSILENFGLDIAVFIKWNNGDSIKIFELKAFMGHRQGGVGFGNGKGAGVQVDLLLQNIIQLKFLNRYLLWIIVDGTWEKGTERYAIFDNITAKKAAMGIIKRGKQNNLRINDLMDDSMSWDKLSQKLEHLLSA